MFLFLCSHSTSYHIESKVSIISNHLDLTYSERVSDEGRLFGDDTALFGRRLALPDLLDHFSEFQIRHL